MYREDINSKINMKQEELKEIQRKRDLVKEKRRELTSDIKRPTMEGIRQARVEQDKQVRKEKERIQKFIDLKAELESMKSSNKTDLYPGKDKAIRKKIQDLIKDEDYEFTGKEAFNKDGSKRKPSIGAITKIDTFIRFLEDGSNIQTFKAVAGGGGGGPSLASRK